MIPENRYHRKKVKALIAENARLKAELEEKTCPDEQQEPDVDLEAVIEEQVEEIKSLKRQMQGYKMLIAKYRKKEKE